MSTPFVYGKVALKDNFTNRTEETNQLVQNFTSLINTVLISPRRWGKSSLVVKAAEMAIKKDKQLRFCFIDLFNVRSEEQFYQMLAQEVLRVSASKLDELMENAKRFLGQFIPRVSLGPDANSEITIGLDWQEVKKQPDDILNLCEKIAKEKKLKFIICIDEFQNVAEFKDHLSIQKKLRANWQKHQNTSYCLYGSKRHMIMDVFTSTSMPFYKFGDIMFLDKIAERHWIPFIKKKFKETGKKIGTTEAGLISRLTECHPYYVQQLAQQSWFRTNESCSSDIVKQAHEHIVLQLSLLFQTLTDELTTTHINFLRTIVEGEKHPSSKDAIAKYQLGTSANVLRIKKALLKKEIIDNYAGNLIILDPLYRHWLQYFYF